MTLRTWALTSLTVLAAATAAHAVGTRYFSLDSASVLSDGKLEGTAVLSTGSIVASVQTRRIALDSTQIARSLLTQPDGSAFIGTGNGGKIYKLTGDVAKVVAETDALVVSALALDASGTLYAGTLPKGKIYAVDKATSGSPAKARELIALPGAEHIAALALDAKKKLLYAATGPEGKVFAIQLGGKEAKADVLYDGEASHIMALALADDGTLYAGTSDEALLVKIVSPSKAEVVFDFEGNEITALSIQGTQLAVAANNFPKPASAIKKPDVKDDKKTDDKTEAPKDEQKPGKGQLWVVTPGARSRKLFTSEQGHLTAVQWADDKTGAIYAATGKEGQIHRVQQDGRSALWIDVDERQVLALDLRAQNPVFTTADAGAAYRVLPKASDALWTSKVLDAQFLSRFGELSFRGKGALKLQTRSGNTDKPNASWSEWSSELDKPGPIRSPAARFLQIRAKLDIAKNPASELYAVTAYYLPLNQAGQVQEVTAKPKTKDGGSEPTTLYLLEWKVDNPDGDKLRYRLSFRPEGEPRGRSILRDSDILTKTTYEWDTESIPDGYYRVAIEASDELESPGDASLKTTLESEPFLIDNKQPAIEGLKLEGGRIRGVARDVPGPVTKLERAIDNGDYEPFYPADDLLDTSAEPFALQLPKLEPGRHVISVRATDARNNRGTAELWITVP
jgi:outer membrane protein assembly factor BamB